MKRITLFFFIFSSALFFFGSCKNNSGTLEDVSWIIGQWKGTDTNDLSFCENWEREDKNNFAASEFIINPDGDTIFKETLKIELVDGNPYYVYTVPKTKGPVLFKMIKGDAKNAVFENKEHDFPQRISYILETKNTMKVKLEGIEKGEPKVETLEYERVNDAAMNMIDVKKDSVVK